jgi:hypothetical protein
MLKTWTPLSTTGAVRTLQWNHGKMQLPSQSSSKYKRGKELLTFLEQELISLLLVCIISKRFLAYSAIPENTLKLKLE